MAIQQDQLTPLDTGVTFEDINTLKGDRILHNGSDIIKCEFHDRALAAGQSPRMVYFQTDGDKATSFTMEEGYVIDLAYDQSSDKYYTLAGVSGGPTSWKLSINEVDNEGQVVSGVVALLDIVPGGNSYSDLTLSGSTQMVVNESGEAYVKLFTDVYKVTLDGSLFTPSGSDYDETDTGITVVSGVVPEDDVLSFIYNDTSGEFLQYTFFDSNTEEVRVKSLTVSGGSDPSISTRQLFLDIPDWAEHAASGVPYSFFLHGTDHNTMFYLRKHGQVGRNEVKASDSDGEFSTSTFTSSAANFTTADVKQGDIIILSDGFGTRKVVNVVNDTTLTLDGPVNSGTTSSIDYTVASNAELKQFNIDPTLSAFAAVNVDDFSLRAGTSDTTTVRAEVISAWGDQLAGKTVNFSVVGGGGVVSPASDITDSAGEATTQYTVGANPDTVQIQATISD
jgi:hypothetical protein